MTHSDAAQRTADPPRLTVAELLAVFLQAWLVAALGAIFVIGRSAYCQRTAVTLDWSLSLAKTAEMVNAITSHERELIFVAVAASAAAALCACGSVAYLTRWRRPDKPPPADKTPS